MTNIISPAELIAEVMAKYDNLTTAAKDLRLQKSTLYEMRTYSLGKRLRVPRKNMQKKFEHLAAALGYSVVPVKPKVQVHYTSKS
jgi:hypothetical protein